MLFDRSCPRYIPKSTEAPMFTHMRQGSAADWAHRVRAPDADG